MTTLLELGSQMIHAVYDMEGTDDELTSLRKKFLEQIKISDDFNRIKDVIILDLYYYSLSFDVIKAIFSRLEEIGKSDDPFLIKWYASMLMHYGTLDDENYAEELLRKHNLTLS